MSDLRLGQLIADEQQRDAIHVAVAPVIAGENLKPGERVKLNEQGEAVKASTSPLGICDPYLDYGPFKGDKFWLFLMPNTVTGMRHHWRHPAFPDESAFASVEDSRAWIEAFAARIDQTYNRLMEAADKWAEYDEYTYDNSEAYKDYWDDFPMFWHHWEVVTRRKRPDDAGSFFTCSC